MQGRLTTKNVGCIGEGMVDECDGEVPKECCGDGGSGVADECLKEHCCLS